MLGYQRLSCAVALAIALASIALAGGTGTTMATTSEECASPWKKCVVSLVSGDNYALGATVLSMSLRATQSIDEQTRLIAIIPRGGLSESSMGWLRARGRFEIVHPPDYTGQDQLGGMRKDLASKRMAAAKLWAWALEDCTRVLYMDSDSFVRRKMPYLDQDDFWRGNISGVQEYDLDRDEFKGGHLAIRPSLAKYTELMAFLQSAQNLTNADQTLLNMVFKHEWQAMPTKLRLPRESLLCSAYCVLAHYKPDKYSAVFNRMIASAPVIDFQGQSKPWNFPKPGSLSFPACEAVVPFVYAWVALALAPDVSAASDALQGTNKFGQMQTVFDQVQGAYNVFAKGDEHTRAYYSTLARAVKDVVDLSAVFK